MDYFVGGVAALLTGNVTPNRPKLARRALTPTKHQPSPNVTPKSEFVDDRSIFMSPTLQKKKAVLKKSPKRIFQNPDLDETNDGDGVSALTSPKAEKVKKHLKSELGTDDEPKNITMSPKSPKKNKEKLSKVTDSPVQKKKSRKSSMGQEENDLLNITQGTPKKKKKGSSFSIENNGTVSDKENTIQDTSLVPEANQSKKKKRKLEVDMNSTHDNMTLEQNSTVENVEQSSKIKKKKQQASADVQTEVKEPGEEKIKKISKSQRRRERKKRTHLKKIKEQLKNLTDSEKALFKAKKNIVQEENKINSHNKKTNQSDSDANQDLDIAASDNDSDMEENFVKTKKTKPTKSVHTSDVENESGSENEQNNTTVSTNSHEKKKKKNKPAKQHIGNQNFNFDSDTNSKMEEETLNKPRKKKLHKKQPINNQDSDSDSDSNSKPEQESLAKKKKKSKVKQPIVNQESILDGHLNSKTERVQEKKKKKSKVNPNAITDQNSDSEHESDDDIESENEEINKNLLKAEPTEGDSSSDEEKEEKGQQKPPNKNKKETEDADDAEVIKRTLFVGNVPFSKKCKKEIKSIFSKYGHIDTVRIRTVPVKDGRSTPKLAVIRSELHPDRSTVNVYVKFTEPGAVDKALEANNTVLNDHHLRVSRADQSGAHDSSRSVFVGNLPFAMEDEGLRQVFERCGHIDSVRIVRDRATNAGKGFGYVNFSSKDGVELALSMSEEDLTVKNRIIRVKRCTQSAQRKQGKRDQGNDRFQGNVQRNSGGNFRDKNQGDNFRGGKFQGRNQGGSFQGPNQGGKFQGRNQGGNFQGRNQGGGFQGRSRDGNDQRGKGRSQGDRQRQDDPQGDGAYRRIMKKRQNTESTEAPPSKVARGSEQTAREKKPRKEFVGITAEKKKKHKINKALKKNKAISEILTKV